MVENEGGESGKMGAFLLGFLVGVLVCVGGGGTLYAVQMHRYVERARQMEELAVEARTDAIDAAAEARRQRALAEKALREVKEREKK